MFYKFFIGLILLIMFQFGQSDGTNNTASENGTTEGELFHHYLANLTRCSKTQQRVLNYSWDLHGFLAYYTFMKKFDQVFEVKTDEISFKSDIVDGKWFFKISKIPTPTTDDIVVSCTYSYEAKQPKKLHFYIKFSLLYNNQEIVFPIQKSTNPIVMQQRLYNRRGYSSYLEYVHSFTWPTLGPAIESMMTMMTNSGVDQRADNNNGRENNVDDEEDEIFVAEERRLLLSQNKGVNKEDVTLKFGIVAYFPTDPVYLGSENCQNILLQQVPYSSEGLAQDVGGDRYASAKNILPIPPYVKHANSMLHDDRFTDVLLKTTGGSGQVFSAHRIILATSSPVFSALLYNSTDVLLDGGEHLSTTMNNNETETTHRSPMIEINLDASQSDKVTEELIRYIYTGRVISLDKTADKLILAAHKYELPDLKKMCEKYLYSKIETGNAIQMYDIGHEVGSLKISKRAFAIMKANKSKLVTQSDEFRRLSVQHPGLMFELFVTP